VTEIENFQKLTHLNQFSRQKHTHARVWVILPQLPALFVRAGGKRGARRVMLTMMAHPSLRD
jgi:hypothetical protein